MISLREYKSEDLEMLFAHQLDAEANYMAAFTRENPFDWMAFKTHWEKITTDENSIIKIITLDENIVGYISAYQLLGEVTVGYWIDKNHWGKGIASEALKNFVMTIEKRPLYARVAFDNIASIKVLQKCGFTKFKESIYYAYARGEDIKEYIFVLND